MNDITQLKLKILVERAVRPVQASMESKRKMREELLGHAIQAFEDEMSRLNDEPAALAQTSVRLGEPAELMGQLQETSRTPRWALWAERWLDPIDGGTALRRALRFGSALLLIMAALIIPVITIQHRLNEWPVIFLMPVVLLAFILGLDWMRESLDRSGWPRWWLMLAGALVSGLAVPTVTSLVCMTLSGNVGSSLGTAISLLPTNLVLMPTGMFLIARAIAGEIRYRREWASLQLD